MQLKDSLAQSRIPVVFVLLFASAVFLSAYFLLRVKKTDLKSSAAVDRHCPDNMNQLRLQTYSYTHPLILSDVPESGTLEPIRQRVSHYIEDEKKQGHVDDVSVYFRRMDDGIWFSINPSITYNVDGMIKLVYLLVYLKDAEYRPGLIDSKLIYNPSVTIKSQLKTGVLYSIRDLLKMMITDGDDGAETILKRNINPAVYANLFRDLKIPVPKEEEKINIFDLSKLLRVLYNGTYLTIASSEYGLKMLTENSFDKGLKQGLDPSLPFAHKFGMVKHGEVSELHEIGIVYYHQSPFMIGVMSKGNSIDNLSGVLREIAKISSEEFEKLMN